MVELAIVLGILTFVLTVFGNVLMSVTRAATQGEALIANEQQSTLAMTQIGRDLRAAYPLTQYAVGIPTSSYQSKVQMTLAPTGSGRQVTDAALTAGSTTIVSSQANFTSSDVNALVSGNGISTGTRIQSVTDNSHAVINPPPGITANNVTLRFVQSSTVTWQFDPTARTLSRSVQLGAGPVSTEVVLTSVFNTSTQPVFSYYSSKGIDLVASGSNQSVAVCTTMVKINLISRSDPGPLPFTETKEVQLRNQLAIEAANPTVLC